MSVCPSCIPSCSPHAPPHPTPLPACSIHEQFLCLAAPYPTVTLYICLIFLSSVEGWFYWRGAEFLLPTCRFFSCLWTLRLATCLDYIVLVICSLPSCTIPTFDGVSIVCFVPAFLPFLTSPCLLTYPVLPQLTLCHTLSRLVWRTVPCSLHAFYPRHSPPPACPFPSH